jgi:hypothetical protein
MSPRPNYVSGCQVQVGHVAEWFNPGCFSLEAPGTLGDVGRNTVIGPGLFDADLGVLKDTRFKENINLQFRAELFNILNRTNYGLPIAPGSQGGASLFQAGGATIPTAGQIFTQAGTPRQIQFALKFIF